MGLGWLNESTTVSISTRAIPDGDFLLFRDGFAMCFWHSSPGCQISTLAYATRWQPRLLYSGTSIQKWLVKHLRVLTHGSFPAERKTHLVAASEVSFVEKTLRKVVREAQAMANESSFNRRTTSFLFKTKESEKDVDKVYDRQVEDLTGRLASTQLHS